MAFASVTILLVDDDITDVMAVKRAFRELKIVNPLAVARDGVDALDMLRGTHGKKKLPHPRLVLVDLNMPRMDGIEFLAELRKDPALYETVAFVLTSSEDSDDRNRANEKNIAGFIVKHQPGRLFSAAMSMVAEYCKTIEFPRC